MAFAHALPLYQQAGWPVVLPLPPNAKTPPPGGFTGDGGADTVLPGQAAQWAAENPGGNIALRLPDGVIGIDVDHYDKPKGDGTVVHKRGADHLAALEAQLGPLPPTWVSGARGWPSGIRLYRVPSGLRFATVLGDAIEIIQRHHRYVIVWPSTNPEHEGAAYSWRHMNGKGEVSRLPTPGPDELPWLPEPWVRYLAAGAAGASTPLASSSEGAVMLAALLADGNPACAEMHRAGERALKKMRAAAEGSRHDALIAAVHDVIHMGAKGHPGAGLGLQAIAELWGELLGGEREDELQRAVDSSSRKAVTAVMRSTPVPGDPCLMGASGQRVSAVIPVPAALVGSSYGPTGGPAGSTTVGQSDDQLVTPPAGPPGDWSVRGLVGAEPFDPRANSDQGIAKAVLERLHPGLRYAADTRDWLLRRWDRWELGSPDLAAWGVHTLAELMPLGDATAEKGSLAHDQAARRAKLMGSRSSGGIVGKMRAAVAAPDEHPTALRLSEVDADPDVLWAGGVPWALRRSADRPEPAQWLPPDTVHLHTALVAPANVPTPRWDAYVAAVLPDPELRAWAMRVLSITLTGHADAALPILWGVPDTGKTQLVVLMMELLGTYGHAADPRLLTGADKAHASIIYDLKGRRLSFIDEGPRRGELAIERLKQITGGAQLTGNRMGSNPVSFKPTHTLVLTTNPEPDVTDDALRKRIRLIPCVGDVDLVRATRLAITGEAWQQEAPGVLWRMITEAGRWLADRSTGSNRAAPASVRATIEALQQEQSLTLGWLADAVRPSETGTRASELYQNFLEWSRRMGAKNAPNITRWGRELTTAGYPATHDRRGKLRLLTPVLPGDQFDPRDRFRPTAHQYMSQNGHTVDNNGAQRHEQVAGVTSSLDTVTSLNPTGHATGHGALSAGQTQSGSTSVTSVTSSRQRSNPNNNNTPPTYNTDMQLVTGHTGHTRSNTPPLTSENQAVTGLVTSFTLSANPSHPIAAAEEAVTPPVPVTESEPAEKPAKAKRVRLTDEEKAERAAARKAAAAEQRAAAKAARVREAEGEVIGLPAWKRRGMPPQPITLPRAAEMLAEQIRVTNELTVDVETSGFPVGHPEYALRTVQLGDQDDAVVFDAADPAQQEVVKLALSIPAALSAHSPTADLVPLDHAGLIDAEDAWLRMHDTAIPAKLDTPAGVENGADLKGLSKARLAHAATAEGEELRKHVFKTAGWATDTEADTPRVKSGWAQINSAAAAMVDYAASDVLDCRALRLTLPMPAPDIYERERAVERVVARVSHRGLLLDGDHVRELHARETAAESAAAARVRALGVDNPASAAQVSQALVQRGALLPLTDEGQPSSAKGGLELLKAQLPEGSELHTAITDVLDFRSHEQALKLFLRPWLWLVNGDSRARPTIYTLGAKTGRMSCVRPNLQQVTREGGYRAAVIADPGVLLISADFSAVEVRVMAALSGDPVLQQIVRRGVDLHSVVAALAFGDEPTRLRVSAALAVGDYAALLVLEPGIGFSKTHRYFAKRGVFGWAYGGGVPTLAAQVGCTTEAMQAIVDALAALAPTYVAWAESVRQAVKRGAHEFPTYAGRTIKLRAPHAAPNYMIQGTARELLVDALLRWADGPWGTCTVLPVHDEVIAFVPEAEAAHATQFLVECMATQLYGVDIAAEASTPSRFWADAA